MWERNTVWKVLLRLNENAFIELLGIAFDREQVLLFVCVLRLFCSEVRFSFPEAALSAHPRVSSAQSAGLVCSWLSLFYFWMGSLFLPSSSLFFFWLTQNGCRCGEHVLKVVEDYFHPGERPDASSFRLCEPNTGFVASDTGNQGKTLGAAPQIDSVFKNWWPHVFLAV